MIGIRTALLAFGLAVLVGAGVAVKIAEPPAAGPPLHGAMQQFIPQKAPVPTPAVGFADEHDQPLDLARYKGTVTLVNFWATWCAPCVKEMPSLEQLKASRTGADFTVVTISEDHQGAPVVDAFFEKNGLKALDRYIDEKGELSRALKLRGLPTTLILDRDGNELGRYEGATDWSGPDALALIDFYRAKPAG